VLGVLSRRPARPWGCRQVSSCGSARGHTAATASVGSTGLGGPPLIRPRWISKWRWGGRGSIARRADVAETRLRPGHGRRRWRTRKGGSTRPSVVDGLDSCGRTSLPYDSAAQEEPEPIVLVVAKAVADSAELLDEEVDRLGGPAPGHRGPRSRATGSGSRAVPRTAAPNAALLSAARRP
jgi:hypothetical protein